MDGPYRSAGGPDTVSIVLPGRFRAAVFDLDGLLADSEPAWAAAEAAVLGRHGLPFTAEDALATRGRSVGESAVIYAERIGLSAARQADLLGELLEEYRAHIPSIEAQPGAIRLVRGLAGRMPLAIASNSPPEVVEATLLALDLEDVFEVRVCADAVSFPKPDPEIYVLACDRLGIPPRDAIAFEDSEPGVRAAAAAGLFCVAVDIPPAMDASAAKVSLRSLEQVQVEASRPV